MMVAIASITPADVAAAYRSHNGAGPSPVALGDAFLACRRELGISQAELARRTNITAGTCHHYESVALLPEPYRTHTAEGRLTFKEARTLADLGWRVRGSRGHPAYTQADPRFEEIAALFISGRLSSVWVEKIAMAAKDDRDATVDEIVQRVIQKAPRKPRNYVDTSHPLRQPIEASTATVRDHILALAGEVDAWGLVEHCEVERMPVLAAARLLTDRLARVVFKTGGVRAPVGVDSLPTVAEVSAAHAGTGNGVGNRRLALLLEEPRKPLPDQEAML